MKPWLWWILAAATWLAERGIDVSGYTNITLAYALWVASGVLFIVGLATIPAIHARLGNVLSMLLRRTSRRHDLPLEFSDVVYNVWRNMLDDSKFYNVFAALYSRLRKHGTIVHGPYYPEAGATALFTPGVKRVLMWANERGDLRIESRQGKQWIERHDMDAFCKKHNVPPMCTWAPIDYAQIFEEIKRL